MDHDQTPFVPNRLVLESNQELRKERKSFALPDNSGHVAFQMGTYAYYYWVNKIPELGAADPTIARNAWRKFLNSEDGAKYKINPHEGKQTPHHTRGVIIK